MNKYTSNPVVIESQQPRTADDEIDLSGLFRSISRNWFVFALAGLIGLALGIAYVATTTRLYMATVDIRIGTSSDIETFQDFSGVYGPRVSDLQLETEMQTLRSERIAERVVRSLQLHQSETFFARRHTGISRVINAIMAPVGLVRTTVRGWFADDAPQFRPAETVSETDREAAAIDRAARMVRGNMQVSNLRGSMIIQVSFRSVSPTLSAQVANGIAAAYIEDQLEATNEASQRAIDWLRERTDQLREQSDRLSGLAEQFRAENNLLGVDIDRLADAEFERLTRNLVDARAELVEMEALSRRLDAIVASNDTSAVVRETASQGITSGLRSRYLEVARSYNNLSTTLGEDHAQTQRRRQELNDIEAMMFDEIRRSADLVRNDVIAARERVASLVAAQSGASQRVGADQAVLTELRELERNAATVSSLYTGFLQRYQEALQRQEIPVSSGLVLNTARPPGAPFAPNPSRILALSLFMSFAFAGVLVVFREWRDDSVRSEDDVRTELGLEYLGALPILKGVLRSVPQQVPVDDRGAARHLHLAEILRYGADNPLSSFAETLRTGKMSIALRHGQSGQSGRAAKIGFVSCSPAEGKTTVSANFANLLAQQGARVMLIDGDMRNPGLTRSLGRSFETGLADVLMGDTDWRDLYHVIDETGLHIIPNSKVRAPHTAELMASRNMANLLSDLSEVYDFVIIDLPPLGNVVDGRAVLDRLDGVFFIVKWGATSPASVKRILRMDPRIREKCYGVFVNLLNPKKARAYGAYQGYHYDRSYYQN